MALSKVVGLVAAAIVTASAAGALADVANDDCGGKKAGDACTTIDNKTGTCAADKSGGLVCDTSAKKSGGCTVAPAGASGDAWMFAAVAGLALAVRRRKR